MTSKDQIELEKTKVLQVYAIFGAALVLSVVPTIWGAVLSLIFGIGILVLAYYTRRKSEHGSLTENHMTYIIRTIWIGSAVALIFLTAGSLYLFFLVDNTPLLPCANNLLGLAQDPTSMTTESLKAIFAPCADGYLGLNFKVFIMSAVIVAVPVLIYFIARFIEGVSRAFKGYRLANPHKWFL